MWNIEIWAFVARKWNLPRINTAGRISRRFATELHGKEGNKGISTAKTQRAQRKARMDPRIREGDQGSRQVIRAFLLLLSDLCVFAVKILGFGAVLKKGK